MLPRLHMLATIVGLTVLIAAGSSAPAQGTGDPDVTPGTGLETVNAHVRSNGGTPAAGGGSAGSGGLSSGFAVLRKVY